MATLTIRNLNDALKQRLRVRAAHYGRSMEQEAREILRATLAQGAASTPNLAEAVRRRFAAAGGVELNIPARDFMRKPPEFGR